MPDMLRILSLAVAFFLATVLLNATSVAQATESVGSHTSSLGPGTSSQLMRWDEPGERMRLRAFYSGSANGSGDRCFDAAIDWRNLSSPSHYDAT